jgi:hypothetical protein
MSIVLQQEMAQGSFNTMHISDLEVEVVWGGLIIYHVVMLKVELKCVRIFPKTDDVAKE